MALGSSTTPDLHKIDGLKSYLRRNKSIAELKALADSTFMASTDEVVITSTSSDGAIVTGQVSFPKWLLLTAVEGVLKDLNVYPVASDGSMPSRQLCTRPDFSRTWSTT